MRRFLLVFAVLGMLLLAGCPSVPKGCSTEGEVCGADGVTYENECAAEAEGVGVVHPGACLEPTGPVCTDSDGGKDIFTSGVCTLDGTTELDECDGPDEVDECYCRDSTIRFETLPCPAGYSCAAGACEELECSDTDSGKKPLEKGTATDSSGSTMDSCVDEDTVKEAYCSGGEVKTENMDCPEGKYCDGGECKEYPCTDSDGGKEPETAGTASKGDDSRDDSCVDGDTVKEYYCEDGEIEHENIGCASGKICVEGECVEAPACDDSDGGKDRYVKGTVTEGGVTHTDSCYSTSSVTEWYCEGEDAESIRLVCGIGFECENGACVEAECTVEEDDFDETTPFLVDSTNTVKLYKTETVGLPGSYTMKLDNVDSGGIELKVYDEDGDLVCTEEIEDNETDDLCGKTDIEANVLGMGYDTDFLENWALLEVKAKWLQVVQGEGTEFTSEGGPECDETTRVYDSELSEFFPRLDESLEGEDIIFMGEEAEIITVDLDDKKVKVKLDGNYYWLEDGKDFDYAGETYDVNVEVTDAGIIKIEIEK